MHPSLASLSASQPCSANAVVYLGFKILSSDLGGVYTKLYLNLSSPFMRITALPNWLGDHGQPASGSGSRACEPDQI